MRFRLILFTLAALAVAAPVRAGAGSPSIPRFWQTLADCETSGRWDWGARHRPGEGQTFVGGLGIYAPNWAAWRMHVGVRGPAWRATPAAQVRVAEWGWRHERAWWGCFAKVGTPTV